MSAGPSDWSSTAILAQAAAFAEPPSLVTLHAAADALLAVTCIGIAGTLFLLVRKQTSLVFPRVFVLFGLFILALGLTHASAALGLWQPQPWLAGAIKLVAAAGSAVAAYALVRVTPMLIRRPSRAELHRINATLEERVAARTADLTQANDQLRREAAQREQAEAEVRRLNAELQARLVEVESLFKLLPVGVAISTDAAGRQIHTNQAFAEIFGVPLPGAAAARSPFEAPASFRVLHEGRELRPDEQPLRRAALRNAPVRDFEGTVVRHDGVAFDIIAHAVPIRDANGHARGSVATFQDITARKQVERQRLDFERKLLQSQKLESIGVLAGGIAHDFNNLLTGVLGHANFARAELARGSTNIDHLLAQVELSAQRAADLCRQLLAYAGKGRFVVRLIDLNVAVEQALPLLRLSMIKKLTLDLQLGSGLPPFRGDPIQINQVLMNLVANASEAISGDNGTVTVRTERVSIAPMDMLTLNSSHEMEPGTFVCLEVRDTGCGIPPEALGHIFEPFFTTKFVGRGLGLAAVLGIVHGHRGGIRVSSQMGAGTTFELFFPVAAAPARSSAPAAPRQTPHLRGAVLVVDDDETVRSFAATVLQSAGYTVTTATDGEDALLKLRRDPLHFDAVLLDLSMPRLGGEDTLMALRMLAPNLPVVLTSGYSEQAVAQRFVGRGLAAFIQKPFVTEALIDAIETVIARTRGAMIGAQPVGSADLQRLA